MHRQLAYRSGFTDEQIDRGELYEHTLMDSRQPIEKIEEYYTRMLEEYEAQ